MSLNLALTCSPTGDYVLGAGAGPPNPNRVRRFDAGGGAGATDFLAYGAGSWGANVSTGDVLGDSWDEILTGPGPGASLGPQVRGFSETGVPMGKINYYAYATLNFGVGVGSGLIERNGVNEILSAAGPGEVFGPHARGWAFDTGALRPIQKVNYFAYGTLKFGVEIAGGDLDGDGLAELLTSPGPGVVFAPTIRGWNYDGTVLMPIAAINFNSGPTRYGADVAGGDADGDAFAEIATAPGAGPQNPPRFRGFDYDGGAVVALPGFDVLAYGTAYGGRVGMADICATPAVDLLTGPGPDPSAPPAVRTFAYMGGVLLGHQPTPFVAFSGAYGVNVVGGTFMP